MVNTPRKPKIDTIVWDADNTLWDWIKMHLEGMRAMAKKLSEITEVSEEEVKESMKRVYDNASTLDHKSLVQDMDVVEQWASHIKDEHEKIRKVIDMAFAVHAVYTHSRHAKFKTYHGLHKVLRNLNDAGVDNIILSDAPLSKVIRRTKQFRIDKYFKAIYGRREKNVGLTWYEGAQKEGGAYQTFAVAHSLSDQKKPEVRLAELLGKKPDEVPDTVAVIGDNFEKDIGTAYNNNCYGLFARYGAADRESVTGLYDFGTPKVVTRNAAGIDLSEENLEMIQKMGDKLKVVNDVREVLRAVMEHNSRK